MIPLAPSTRTGLVNPNSSIDAAICDHEEGIVMYGRPLQHRGRPYMTMPSAYGNLLLLADKHKSKDFRAGQDFLEATRHNGQD